MLAIWVCLFFVFFPDPCLTVTSDLHLAHDAVMNLCEYTLLFAD